MLIPVEVDIYLDYDNVYTYFSIIDRFKYKDNMWQ